MSRALPNFNIGDRIHQWVSLSDEGALRDIQDYYDSHPRKFRVTLAWAVGRDSETFDEVLGVVKTRRVEVLARVKYV